MGLSIKNFSKQNTPELAQKIGNYCLIIAAAGTAIVGLPATLEASGITGFVLPPFILIIGKAFIAIGVFSKIFVKMFGTEETYPVK